MSEQVNDLSRIEDRGLRIEDGAPTHSAAPSPSSILHLPSSSCPLPLPAPRTPINIRPGTMEDIPFLDSLQKMHTKQVGWMPTKQFEGKIKLGHVLVAWAARPRAGEGAGECVGEAPTPQEMQEERVGYLIGNDQYFKRDDLGIIYQMNVVPGKQRALVGASLLKAQFERSAYGCKLYCCWCAQDIEANRFWEACGFVPLAFRTGSRTKGPKREGSRAAGGARVHIFWQKRIREGDTTTPWWFPSQTTSGAIREDRLVLPIPPGVKWNDVMPVVLPRESPKLDVSKSNASRSIETRSRKPEVKSAGTREVGFGFLSFHPPPAPPAPAKVPATVKVKQPKAPRVKVKNDPQHIAAARELRDRWLEQVNAGAFPLESCAKYAVSRAIADGSARSEKAAMALPFAA